MVPYYPRSTVAYAQALGTGILGDYESKQPNESIAKNVVDSLQDTVHTVVKMVTSYPGIVTTKGSRWAKMSTVIQEFLTWLNGYFPELAIDFVQLQIILWSWICEIVVQLPQTIISEIPLRNHFEDDHVGSIIKHLDNTVVMYDQERERERGGENVTCNTKLHCIVSYSGIVVSRNGIDKS